MGKKVIFFGLLFVIIILLQVTIFDNILLFGYASPIVFIYCILRLPVSMNKNVLLTIAFLSGLTVDVFADTTGMNALACTFLAAFKHPVFGAYTSKELDTDGLIPSISSLGWIVYMKYLLTLVLLYCTMVFVIEYFSFFNVKEMMLRIGASTLLTFVLLLALDSLMMPKSEKRL